MKVLLLIAAALPFITGQGNIVGDPRPYTPNLSDPYVVFAVNAIKEDCKSNGDQRPRDAVQVVSATKQVVAGTRYVYEIEFKVGNVYERCTIAVWSRPWMPPNEKLLVVQAPVCRPKT
ncbi:hypothetical protein BsWGS_10490 [Bradybaena similaris]